MSAPVHLMDLLVALHRPAERQGPGGDMQTLRALALCGLEGRTDIQVADIGCGTGASTFVLARELVNQLARPIQAVDFLPAFLKELEDRANEKRLSAQIQTVCADMEKLPFQIGTLDLIWSEGAIYNVGFAAGIEAWKSFLKPNGVLAVSELTWLTDKRPAALQDHWDAHYEQVATAGEKLQQLERAGYQPLGYFPLERQCWMDNYYTPMRQRFPTLLSDFENAEAVQQLVAEEEQEIALYERFSDFVSYGFYIARRAPS